MQTKRTFIVLLLISLLALALSACDDSELVGQEPPPPVEATSSVPNISAFITPTQAPIKQATPAATPATTPPAGLAKPPVANQPPAIVSALNCLPAQTPNGDAVQTCVNIPTTHPQNKAILYARLVIGGKPMSGAKMETVWTYHSSHVSCDGLTGFNGVASCTREVAPSARGYKVSIAVSFTFANHTYYGSTSFTPLA